MEVVFYQFFRLDNTLIINEIYASHYFLLVFSQFDLK